MSLIRALITAAEAERFRCMTGGGKGILKAIATRDHTEQPLSHEDYEWAKTILGQALDREWELVSESRAADEAFEQSASRLASRHTLPELRKLRDRGLTYRTEIVGDTRRTSAAVNNEAHRHSWEHQRLYDRAIHIKQERNCQDLWIAAPTTGLPIRGGRCQSTAGSSIATIVASAHTCVT